MDNWKDMTGRGVAIVDAGLAKASEGNGVSGSRERLVIIGLRPAKMLVADDST